MPVQRAKTRVSRERRAGFFAAERAWTRVLRSGVRTPNICSILRQTSLRMMRLLGWLRPDPAGWRVTESGAIWGHRLQALYSLAYIDDLWQRCQHEPWPDRVVLA